MGVGTHHPGERLSAPTLLLCRTHRSTPVQQSPISLAPDSEYETLLPGRNVTFTAVDGGKDAPEWAHVVVDGSVRLIGMREVSRLPLLINVGPAGVLEVMAYDRVFSRAGFQRSHVHP